MRLLISINVVHASFESRKDILYRKIMKNNNSSVIEIRILRITFLFSTCPLEMKQFIHGPPAAFYFLFSLFIFVSYNFQLYRHHHRTKPSIHRSTSSSLFLEGRNKVEIVNRMRVLLKPLYETYCPNLLSTKCNTKEEE